MHLKKQIMDAWHRGDVAASRLYEHRQGEHPPFPICPYPLKSGEAAGFWEGFHRKIVWLFGNNAARNRQFSSANPYLSCPILGGVWQDGFETGSMMEFNFEFDEGFEMGKENTYPPGSPEFFAFQCGRRFLELTIEANRESCKG